MANVKPPGACAGRPAITGLPAGSVLFRVHQVSYLADEFTPVPTHRYYGGGRFDSTEDDRYPFLYAGESVAVAIAETLLRDLPPDAAGVLQLPSAKVRGRRVSAIVTTTDLDLVSLRSARDLGALGQDTWLTTCDPHSYAQSRHWAHWIRSHAPHAAGYCWMSKREPAQSAFILFGDRVPAGAVAITCDPGLPADDEAVFDTARGRRALRRRLADYNVALSRR